MSNYNPLPEMRQASVQLDEHLLFISPSQQVKDELMVFKKDFHNEYEHIQAIRSKPHITLINFGALNQEQELLIQKINEALSFHYSFDVELKNFAHFGTHTIYAALANPSSVVGLVKSLREKLYFLNKRAFFSLHPHLTIAKGLSEDRFYPAMASFHKKQYSASFHVGSIVLMKRKDKFMKYEMVKEFELKP